ncbi:hypothetical protein DQD37_23405, partial [Salmonella enterica subsp. enterica serovar Cardoner]|nr:hypothetical protein [Salmonella enterica subsp. enterica serovar Cardoner]
MPFYDLPTDAIYGPEKNTIEQPEAEYGDNVAPSLYEMFTPSNTGEKLRSAAFRIDNTLGSWVASAPFSQFEEVEGYNPFANDAGELKGYEDYADSFIDSGSPQETAAIKQRIDQQIQDKQYLQEAGGAGTVSSLAMGMIDPINVAAMFVPGGAVAKGAKFAETATKAALSGAAGSVASEAMFHATQETRTLEESMMNITVDAMVSGILGGSASLIADYTARKALNDSVKSTLEGTDVPRSIGAAEVATTTMDQEQLAGLGLVNKTLSVTPGGRLAQSPSYTARTTGQMLAENNYFYAKNDEGLATFSAAETAVKRYKAVTAKTYETVKDSYKAYSKTNPSNRMSQTEFYEEIGKAMRRGDSHLIPEINQAASQLRPVFEQLKTRMQELGMLPEDVKVKTAESYLPRIYQFDKITSDRTGFKKIIADWLEGNNARVVEKANGKFEKTAALIKRSEDATQQAPVLESEILEAERWAG